VLGVENKLHSAAELAAYKTGQVGAADESALKEKYLRLAAEFDNYKKRTARQYAEIVKNASEDLVVELLGVIDDFQRALQTIENEKNDNDNESIESVVSGMRLIYGKLMNILKSRGVEQIDPVGQPFDPQHHDAVMQMPSEKDEGTVISVISPGFIMNGKVIRHAKVIVASSK
jgi:molecular chaperone GrpE